MNTTFEKSVNRCIIITGMSGGGKSAVLDILEDQGLYAVDNLPPSLLPQLLQVLQKHSAAVKNGVAAVMDIRGEELLRELEYVISTLNKTVADVQLLFLDASDSALLRRFDTTRRRHPLGGDRSTLEGITEERKILESVRREADMILDSTDLTMNELRASVLRNLKLSPGALTVFISSFGFKYGVPMDCDYLFDVRFLPNPNYIPTLHALSGCDLPVQEYLNELQETTAFTNKIKALFDVILPLYYNTGKQQIHIAIGCTGGRHRSVALTEKLAKMFKNSEKIVVVSHRDMHKEYSN